MSDIPIYQLVFSMHAINRMFERGISRADVRHVLVTGKVIKEYPHDVPYLSRLVLGWSGNRALHVVVAINVQAQKIYIVTVYEPDSNLWEPDFRSKKS